MTLYIKNMVCIRCKMVVKSELEKLGFNKTIVTLGEARIREVISVDQREKLNSALKKSGFEILDENKSRIIDKIKGCIVEMVHYSDEKIKNLPDYLSKMLLLDYSFLDSLFQEVQNISIERFIERHKIERVKELLVYYKLNLTEITYQLNYRSVAQLSSHFKDVTGFSPSHFVQMKDLRISTMIKV